MSDGGTQRIDRWLWHARFARTRGAAQRLALSGHVRVNREKVASASRPVRIGDVLTIALERRVVVIRISGFAERRGSADLARTLYSPEAASDGRQDGAPERGEPADTGEPATE